MTEKSINCENNKSSESLNTLENDKLQTSIENKKVKQISQYFPVIQTICIVLITIFVIGNNVINYIKIEKFEKQINEISYQTLAAATYTKQKIERFEEQINEISYQTLAAATYTKQISEKGIFAIEPISLTNSKGWFLPVANVGWSGR